VETIRKEKGVVFDGIRYFVPHAIVDEIVVSSNFGESTYSLAMALGHFVIGNNFWDREQG
jgi:hypothetical protein